MRKTGGIVAMGLCGLMGLLSDVQAQSTAVRYFYDDSGQLFRALDSSGTLLEYVYDPVGNILEIKRGTISPTALSILSISPLTAGPGATIRIYGQNFSTAVSGNVVRFNGVTAVVLSASSTELVVQVPTGSASGSVSVTVNGATVSSGSLQFAGLAPPTISRVLPDGGISGQLASLSITGSGLENATITTVPAGGVSVGASGSTDFSVSGPATLGLPGLYTLVATNSAGSSTSLPNAQNQVRILESSGETYFPISVLNSGSPAGLSEPTVVSSESSSWLVSVLNAGAPAPGTPDPTAVTSEAISERVAVLNGAAPPNGTPEPTAVVSEAIGEMVSVLNRTPPPDGTAEPTTVSSEAQAATVSVLNSAPGAIGSAEPTIVSNEAAGLATTVLRTGGADAPTAIPSGAEGELERVDESGQTMAPSRTVMGGETIVVRLSGQPAGVASYFLNGASAGRSSELIFEAPQRAEEIVIGAVIEGPGGVREAPPLRLTVAPPATTEVRGRVLYEAGGAAGNTTVEMRMEGLVAELFDFRDALSGLPDLEGLTPVATRMVAGLNQLNPEGVFGRDPLGWDAAPDYAVRYRGRLRVEAEGLYTFALRARAGAAVRIDGAVVDSAVKLSAGEHELEVVHFEATGDPELQLLWTPPGGAPGPIPQRMFSATVPGMRVKSDSDGRFRMPGAPAWAGAIQVTVGEGKDTVTSELAAPAGGGVTEMKEIRIRGQRRN